MGGTGGREGGGTVRFLVIQVPMINGFLSIKTVKNNSLNVFSFFLEIYDPKILKFTRRYLQPATLMIK